MWPLTLMWRKMSSMHGGTTTLERGVIRQRNWLSACGRAYRNFSNFSLMVETRRELPAAFFCGLFIGLSGVATACALCLATVPTTPHEILK